ncbi:MAG: 3'-5' exonuclease domain-containing protein 2 [Prevotella sp.]|nr:3'-5' exonuclease domain-containing protein 2 [Prevotella sp.]MBQ6200757.1 3'-5' exonuclease domain-containing protein 2 [Prevotella sp.]
MKKLIYNKVDKAMISHLKRVEFYGKIYVVTSPVEAEHAVDYLLSQPILGFDTETRPAFEKGKRYYCSLLQVSTRTECFLFRLNRIGLCPAVKRLLGDKTVTKVGLAWNNDMLSLRQLGNFEPGHFIDLQDMVRELGIEDQSLVKIYANLFIERISKAERLSNWERHELTERQMEYAAIDAWACVRIYNEVSRLLATRDYELEVRPEENVNQNNETSLS